MIGPDLQCIIAVLVGRPRGDHDHRQRPQMFVSPQVTDKIEAIHARHFDVGENHIRRHFEQLLERIDAILGQNDLITLTRQQAADNLAHGQRVIDHHHGRQFGLDTDSRRRYRSGHRRTPTGQRHRVENKHDLTIAQHGCPGNADDTGKLGANVLDDDFLVALQLIDLRRHALRPGAQQQHPVAP
ncbi:MAG: hypothetical protein ACD_10C00151G0001, partial [uncultured bacterium]